MGLSSKIAKTLNMLLPCGRSHNVGASNDLTQLAEKLRNKASELGQCLRCIEEVFNLTRPSGGALLDEWKILKDDFSKMIMEIRRLIQKAIIRIRDLHNVAVFLSDPTEKDKKAREIQLIANDLTAKSKQAGETILNLRDVLGRVNEFWVRNGPGGGHRAQAFAALQSLGRALQDSQLDNALVDVLKSTSFPGTISSTVRLLPDDVVSLHEMIDGKNAEVKIELIDATDEPHQIATPLNQFNSLLNIWRIVLTDLKAVERHPLDDRAQILKYQAKLRVVMGVYELYGRSLEAF
ncbi:hypothetical protein SCHPADRAFT_997367 [Schizopora paradoxa]|uniref:Uncharacterized protein n=1 Tax=Schizopora paradoxa TaxID=27342 RepID=A0A0H2S9G3_9AGAM|nr:hypothetical protein SCHPADRAFT_997367 [Schizopora paradoxa]